VVVLGLDGMDAALTAQFLAEGVLPHLAALGRKGCFGRLQTTLPAESPVAWSTFMTGCRPGKHRIFDFLVPDRRALRPELAAGQVHAPARSFTLGPYRIPLGRPGLEGRRQSRPFWAVLGEHGVFSSIVRVPVTFPPERFHGVLLAGMCAPDLLGSQGTYFLFTTDPAECRQLNGGLMLPLRREGQMARGALPGPDNPLAPGRGAMQVPVSVRVGPDGAAELEVGRQRLRLAVGRWSEWVEIVFRPGLGRRIRGLCRFRLLQAGPHVRLYATPLHIDPAHPVLPLSHPRLYSVYLAKRLGRYATLGVAEDLAAVNEGVLDQAAFLEQCGAIQAEREAMLWEALARTPRGLTVCVFDIVDRVQHLFWRQMEDPQRALDGADPIRQTYRAMDELVGRVCRQLPDGAALLVLSDHGCAPFRWQVDLNAWLRERGYLSLRSGRERDDLLAAVDWGRTRAYALGFGGIYVNQEGREAQGIVPAGAATAAVKAEIAAHLGAWRDGDQDGPVMRVYDRDQVYRGPYVEDAPDLVVGLRPGYRVAWKTVTGGVGPVAIAPNERPWSGDHNVDPTQVPGVLFSNLELGTDACHLADVGPTVLDLLGVEVPAYMDGRSLALPGPLPKGDG
jgi:predicted AlkP superfamily phosphohydrolase/phosphomutase